MERSSDSDTQYTHNPHEILSSICTHVHIHLYALIQKHSTKHSHDNGQKFQILLQNIPMTMVKSYKYFVKAGESQVQSYMLLAPTMGMIDIYFAYAGDSQHRTYMLLTMALTNI